MSEQIFTVSSEYVGQRTDIFLSDMTNETRSSIQKLLSNGNIVAVKNGAKINIEKKTPVTMDMSFIVDIPEPEECVAKPENIPLDVIYEDNDLIVINKPKDMVVHPAAGHENGTLVSALLYHCGDSLSGINGVLRPGIIHRIDKDTTGLIVAAKNDHAHLSLASQLAVHSMHRTYYAIVTGNIKDDKGTINAPIGRHPVDRKKMAVILNNDKKSRYAITHYEVIERYTGFTLLKIQLETGRTHQIRVHMASIGHPLAGDILYGGGKTLFEKKHPKVFSTQLLHAKEITFVHPTTNEQMTLVSDLPEYFEEAIRLLKSQNN